MSESWVLLFKIQVFLACVSFSIIVPSLAPYLARMGAPEYVLGVVRNSVESFARRAFDALRQLPFTALAR